MVDRKENIVLFDGVCNLCNGLVRFIIKRDPAGKFKFASLQSEAALVLLEKPGVSGSGLDSIVLITGNEYYLKSTAALKILSELGGFWKLFYFFILIPRVVRDFVYDMIAKSRYTIFGRKDECMVPTPELKNRFL